MSKSKSVEVIVVGAGVIGASCAYHLAKRGAKVLVLEASHSAAGASGATAAMIEVASDAPDPLYPLALESAKLIPQIVADFDEEPQITLGGSIHTAVSEFDVAKLHAAAKADERLNIESTVIDSEQVHQLEPLLSEAVVAGLYRPESYHLNPFLLCHGLLRAATRRGCQIKFGVRVLDVQLQKKSIGRVVTDTGDFYCDWFVNAAGAHAPQIMRSSGWQLPIEPSRGQIIVTEAAAPLTPRLINSPGHLYARQTAQGNFLIGSHTETVGFDKRITLEKITLYASAMALVMPILTQLKVIRFYAGFRPLSLDDLPILGPLPNCPRFLVATGHGRSGVLHSAVTGLLISELVVDGRAHLPIDSFSIERFTTYKES